MTGTEISKWSDRFMFKAEESNAAEGVKVFLLGGPADPLGQIAACALMYTGVVVRDTADVTDEQRREFLEQVQKTVLGMPLEAVSLHFMIEGVTRGFTHQMVRQRTAAYAQESTRFAVKEDMKTATALPPSLADTKNLTEFADQMRVARADAGLQPLEDWNEQVAEVWRSARASGGPQLARLRWDQAVDNMGDAYLDMVNAGIPAEDARGLLPTNITTRLNYITNLRNWYDTMAVRVSDQAQFEWRSVAMHMAMALREYGKTQTYWTTVGFWEYQSWQDHVKGAILQREFVPRPEFGPSDKEPNVRIKLSSEWQYVELSNALKPIEFKLGKRAFGANFDRPSRIGERVDAFASKGVPSSDWTKGSVEHGIPPIHPEEWLLDPNSARLNGDQEFDVFGERVPKGRGWHWNSELQDGKPGLMRNTNGNQTDGYDQAHWPQDFETSEQ